jgi:hypothetical protein
MFWDMEICSLILDKKNQGVEKYQKWVWEKPRKLIVFFLCGGRLNGMESDQSQN